MLRAQVYPRAYRQPGMPTGWHRTHKLVATSGEDMTARLDHPGIAHTLYQLRTKKLERLLADGRR